MGRALNYFIAVFLMVAGTGKWKVAFYFSLIGQTVLSRVVPILCRLKNSLTDLVSYLS